MIHLLIKTLNTYLHNYMAAAEKQFIEVGSSDWLTMTVNVRDKTVYDFQSVYKAFTFDQHKYCYMSREGGETYPREVLWYKQFYHVKTKYATIEVFIFYIKVNLYIYIIKPTN